MPWTSKDIPDLRAKTIVVTGGNSGIGYEAALQLAGKGADVVLACRDTGKAEEAAAAIRRAHSEAQVESMQLDLASLASVREFAERYMQSRDRLDVLCNNAGVMAIPQRKTAEGFEMQIGTNHLGHFALTGLLLERLLGTAGARIVTVSSTAHRGGRMDFDDLHRERRYQRWLVYGQSKLANLLFAYELQRRLREKNFGMLSVACHPGYAATNLQLAGARMEKSSLKERFWKAVNAAFAQSAEMGALPTLYAATEPGVKSGDYIGPGGFAESRGYPKKVESSARSRDPKAAARLWALSEEMTGVRYSALG
jgi:NAD(P)-dependent dehydrogenase (short-subunit alcohol dehydrogenase family)